MKMRYTLFIMIYLFTGCVEETSITKKHLNFDDLLIVSSNNEYFKAFIIDHSDNILTMISLSENDYLNLGKELEILRLKKINEIEIYSIMSRFNLKANAYLNFQLFYDFLNSEYTYTKKDLNELIIRSIADPLESQRNKIIMPPVLTCTTICTIHSVSVKQHYLDLGFPDYMAGAIGSQAYTSCMYGCTYEF